MLHTIMLKDKHEFKPLTNTVNWEIISPVVGIFGEFDKIFGVFNKKVSWAFSMLSYCTDIQVKTTSCEKKSVYIVKNLF